MCNNCIVGLQQESIDFDVIVRASEIHRYLIDLWFPFCPVCGTKNLIPEKRSTGEKVLDETTGG